MSNKRVTVEKINLTPLTAVLQKLSCLKQRTRDYSFFLFFSLSLSSSSFFPFLYDARDNDYCFHSRARARLSTGRISNFRKLEIVRGAKERIRDSRNREKRTRGRDFTVGSRRNFYDRKPWQFGGLFFAIQRDHGYRNNTTRSPYLFPSDFFIPILIQLNSRI